MILPIALIAGYIYGVSRTKTFTEIEKRELMGSKSGTIYRVEIIPSIPLLAVKAPDGSQIQFEGNDLVFKAAYGDKASIAMARLDFEGCPFFKGITTHNV